MRPAAIKTLGFEVLVQEVIAAILRKQSKNGEDIYGGGFANLNAGDVGRDRLKFAANAVRSVRLRVKGFVLRRPAGHE